MEYKCLTVPLHMNLVPQFSSIYYQNIIFQKLYFHFLFNIAIGFSYDRAYGKEMDILFLKYHILKKPPEIRGTKFICNGTLVIYYFLNQVMLCL